MIQISVAQQVAKSLNCSFTYFLTSSKLSGMAANVRAKILEEQPSKPAPAGEKNPNDKPKFISSQNFVGNIVGNSLGQILTLEFGYMRAISKYLNLHTSIDFSHDGLAAASGVTVNLSQGSIQALYTSSGALLCSLGGQLTPGFSVNISSAVNMADGFEIDCGAEVSIEM